MKINEIETSTNPSIFDNIGSKNHRGAHSQPTLDPSAMTWGAASRSVPGAALCAAPRTLRILAPLKTFLKSLRKH